MKNDQIEFSHDKENSRKFFNLKYKDIAISNATKANEVQLEFEQDQEESKR